jgi:hypothetical protein
MKSLLRFLFLPLLILTIPAQISLAPVPVTLISFSAIPDNIHQKISLLWETGSELDFAGFYIQRSLSPDSDFTRLVDRNGYALFIPAQGEGGAGAHYFFNDNNVVIGQIFYYRLEMIDLGGTTDYSEIISSILGNSFYLPIVQN